MVVWDPASRQYVEQLLTTQLAALSPAHRARWSQIAVPLRAVPIASDPGALVFVAAQFDGQVIYFEDVEEGWNVARLDPAGGIASRGFEQDELVHVMFKLFGTEGAAGQMPPNKSLERTRDR